MLVNIVVVFANDVFIDIKSLLSTINANSWESLCVITNHIDPSQVILHGCWCEII